MKFKGSPKWFDELNSTRKVELDWETQNGGQARRCRENSTGERRRLKDKSLVHIFR